MRNLIVLVATTMITLGLTTTQAQAIEAVKGKHYRLTERHGPWMIMVASFRDVPEDRRKEGLSAEEAAQELVHELRIKGIPAYAYAQDAKLGHIDTVDRLGREDSRIYAAQRDMISVIAGNYSAIDDDTAQKTLDWIKGYTPDFMKQENSGAIYRESPGRRGPLAGAFLTINPLLKPDQVVRRKADPEIVRWNNSTRFPLMECRKTYTVQVATFTGRQTTPIAGSKYNGKAEMFDRDLQNAASYGLNRAGEDAEHLVAELRRQGVEAYVHHDRYQSIVTVGSFDSPQDPTIVRIQQEYGPSYKKLIENEREVLTPYILQLPNPEDARNKPPLATWVFDVSPQLIRVPRYN